MILTDGAGKLLIPGARHHIRQETQFVGGLPAWLTQTTTDFGTNHVGASAAVTALDGAGRPGITLTTPTYAGTRATGLIGSPINLANVCAARVSASYASNNFNYTALRLGFAANDVNPLVNAALLWTADANSEVRVAKDSVVASYPVPLRFGYYPNRLYSSSILLCADGDVYAGRDSEESFDLHVAGVTLPAAVMKPCLFISRGGTSTTLATALTVHSFALDLWYY